MDSDSVFLSETSDHRWTFTVLGNNRQFYQWLPQWHEEFINWWSQTDWVINRIQDHGADILVKRVNWNMKQTAECWNTFDQVANKRTGEPFLCCQVCQQSIAHPRAHGINAGTTALRNHLRASRCKRYQSNNNNQGQLSFSGRKVGWLV